MAQPTVNRFLKGLNSDLSLTDRPQDLYLDGHNIRLARREEGTLWAANIKGTEETFQLSDGFTPLGSAEYDGYLFIISVNEATGEGEIGSFPSVSNTNQIVRAYNPLQNYTNVDYVQQIGDDCILPEVNNLGTFRTTLLNLSCDKPIRMQVRLDFDGSVNLYWTDDENPWRVINNGFVLATGEENQRYITENMILNGYINGVNESEKHPTITLIREKTGGRLEIGQYFFFVRYTDLNFNATSFLGQSGPIPVFNTNVQGQPVTSGGEPATATDKALDLLIENLDPSIGFFEIGYARYYGRDIFDSYLIDKRYSIIGNTFRQIRVTGNEPLLPITTDELIVQKPSDALICKDFAQQQNQLYLGNTRGPVLDHPDLRRFMCALTLDEGLSPNGPAEEINLSQNDNPYSLEAKDTEERVGYFSGETYIFAVIPVFKGGFKGVAYPLTGVDNYAGIGANANKSGIYRFRKAHLSPFWFGGSGNTFIKNINVDTTNAQPIYQASQWLKDNLIGVYVSRADRNEVLLYQGLNVRCYNGNLNPRLYEDGTSLNVFEQNGNIVPIPPRLWGPNPEDFNTDRSFPLFEPATYEMLSKIDISLLGANRRSIYFNYAAPYDLQNRNDFTDPSRMAVFSPDYFLDKVSIPATSYIQMVGRTDFYSQWRRESTSLNTLPINNTDAISGYRNGPTDTGPSFLYDATDNPVVPVANRGVAQTFVGYNQLGLTYEDRGFQSSTIDVVGFNVPPNQNFVSAYDEGKIASDDGMYYYERRIPITEPSEYEISLPAAAPDYIGIKNGPTYAPTFDGQFDHYTDPWDRSIVNVCRTNPDFVNYLDLYDFKNTFFYPIGDFQPIDDFLGAATHTYYRGDCLVKRSYLKIYHARVDSISSRFFDILSLVEGQGNGYVWLGTNNSDEAQEDFQRGYGHWVSIVTECKYNADYRHELGRNLFYPKTNVEDPGKDFAWLFDSPESPFFNGGYLKMLGPNGTIGIDLLQPTSNNKFPTRIRPSLTHAFGAIRDGYRQFIPVDAKDFDYSAGEIQALVANRDVLYSFQNRAINLHPINERITQQGNQGSTAILGESTGLTQYKQIIKQGYGTQHRFSVINANQAIYCIDWNKRAVLRILGADVQVLDVAKGVQTWFRNIIAGGSSGYSDVLEQLPNEHPCGRGIHGIYNRKFKEVLWTFRLGDESKTIAYSEEMDTFLGTHGYLPIHYGQVEEDLYSFIDNRGWLHDVSDKYDTFYGVLDEWFVEIVVNESSELTKHWDSLIINSNNRVFSKIGYETQHQTALQDPFMPTEAFWYAPTYRENQWRIPIRRQDATKEPEESIYDDFTQDLAPLRGRYIKIKLTYDQDKELWVREIITFYNPSFT